MTTERAYAIAGGILGGLIVAALAIIHFAVTSRADHRGRIAMKRGSHWG